MKYILSLLFLSVVKIRYLFYFLKIRKPKKAKAFVISVGNIVLGGTGKTPFVIYLADKLKEYNKNIVIISRGYKGKKEREGGIVGDGTTIFMTPKDSGDEPYLIAKKTLLPVYVGKNRIKSIDLAEKKFSPDIIILDDAFQNFKIVKDLEIVLLDYSNPFGGGYLFPKGFLREPLNALKRGDIFVFTRCNDLLNENSKNYEILSKYTKKERVFKTIHKPFFCSYLKNCDGEFKESSMDLAELKDKKAFAFSGISNNESFKKTAIKLGLKLLGHICFSDHHNYTKKDFIKINKKAKELRADFLVTSEKDIVKIDSYSCFDIDILIVGVKISFIENDNNFIEYILNKKS